MKKFDLEKLYKRPITVQIDATSSCNLSCAYCYNKSNFVDKDDLNDEQFMFMIRKVINELNPVRVCFSGGETLLRKKIFLKSAKLLKANEIDVHINTNGFLIDVKTAKEMKKIGVDLVRIAVDSLDSLDNTTRWGKSLNKTLEVLSKYFYSDRVVIACVVRKSNYKSLLDMAKFVKKRGFGTFHLLDLIPCDANSKKEMLSKEEWIEFYKIYSEIKKIGVNIIPNHALLFVDGQTKRLLVPFCMAGKYKMILTAGGFVVPCNYFKTKDYICGNVKEDNLLEIWQNSEILKKFRYPLWSNKKCKNCSSSKFCQGGCKALAEKILGDPFGGDPYCIKYGLA